MTKKIELDKQMRDLDDPLYFSPDKPFILAKQAAQELGIPMRNPKAAPAKQRQAQAKAPTWEDYVTNEGFQKELWRKRNPQGAAQEDKLQRLRSDLDDLQRQQRMHLDGTPY